MASRVLIVDDERDLAELLAYNLQRAGYATEVVHDGRTCIDTVDQFRPDIILLDVMMPGLTGTEVAERLRRSSETRGVPIIMLTARTEETDELEALSAGADDYVTKPFSMRVLEARIEALLRRSGGAAEGSGAIASFGPLKIDTDVHEVTLEGRHLNLTATEFKLLESLVGSGGRVLSRQSLIAKALGPGVTVTERTIDVHVTSIRKKLGEHAVLLRTVRGVGYRLAGDGAREAAVDDRSPEAASEAASPAGGGSRAAAASADGGRL